MSAPPPNVTRLAAPYRGHVKQQATTHQKLQGIVAEIEALPAKPSAAAIRAIAVRLDSIADPLEPPAGEVQP